MKFIFKFILACISYGSRFFEGLAGREIKAGDLNFPARESVHPQLLIHELCATQLLDIQIRHVFYI
jgi:transposase